MTPIRFYFDENVEAVVADQLALHKIDVVRADLLGFKGDDDETHLRRAHQMARVLFTHDTDFLRLNSQGLEHSGIAFLSHFEVDVGVMVRELRLLHANTSAEDAVGHVFFLSSKRR